MTTKTIQMYRTNLDGSETTLYPLTEAKYVTMDNGTTIEEALTNSDSSKYSPVIESSKAMFKVGEGDSVDLSESAIDGAYNSCVLKGKTMVNCIQEPSSQDVVLPYEFEDGQYVTINDTKESGALGVELKGNTLVNSVLFIDKTLPYTWVSNNISSRTCSLRGNFKTGTYVLIVDFGEVLLGGVQSSQGVSCSIQVNYTNGTLDAYVRNGLENYSNKRLFTPFNINNEVSTIEFKGVSEQYENATTEGYIPPTVTVNKIMIIEYQEGMENWDIPYFTGMTSCKMPILHTVGKNLYSKENVTVGKYVDANGGLVSAATDVLSDYIRVKPNTTYAFKVMDDRATSPYGVKSFFDFNKKFISRMGNHSSNDTFATPANCYYIRVHHNAYTQCGSTIPNCMLVETTEKPSTISSHEDRKSSILSLPEEVVLRGIGDVKDTLNLTTGEYVQRIGSITASELEASDYFKADLELENTVQFGMLTRGREKLRAKTSAKSVCNIIPVMLGNDDVFHARVDGGTPYGSFTIWMDKTKLETEDVFGLIKWLRDNNAVIQYELATPIVTKINLSSTLKSWNTTTHIYSEIPENTLYPILSHSNPSYPVILKPSTKYSIVANSYSNNHTNSTINFNLGGATTSTTVGNRVTTITTPSTLTSEELVMSGRGNKLNNVMVIEGDIVGDEPYFEGICDCKSPILSNCGKNLFDGKIELGGIGSNGIPYDSDVLQRSMNFTRVSPNTTYKISDTSAIDGFNIIEYDFNKNIIERNWMGNKPFTTKTNCHYVKWFNSKVDEERFVIIEQGSYPSPYEPYKSNTTTFEQKDDKTIVLRSLPSGVCDTLNVETGEYVQRIGEVMLNGSEQWSSSGYVSQNHYCAFTSIENSKNMPSYNIMCNSFPVRGVLSTDVDYEGCMLNSGANGANFVIKIANSKLSSIDVNGFKAYLHSNPIIVQYELATPIVTTVDVQGFPYAYTNGHVQLSSGSIEQSLTPKVEYSLVANRNGQIEANTKSIRRHQDKLDDFEALMLTQMIQTHYEKTLLQFDFEMQMMALGGE